MGIMHGKSGTVTYDGEQANVTKWSMTINAETHENTVMGGTRKDRILGLKDWTADVECFSKSGDNGPMIGDTAALTEMAAYDDSNDTSVDLVLSNGARKITGKAYAESFSVGSPVDGMTTVSIHFVGDGLPAFAADV